MSARGSFALLVLYVLVAVAAAGCSFSNYQSARMLPQGGTSLTGAFSLYKYDEGPGSADDEAFEFIGSHGITDQFELGGKLAFFTGEEGSRGFNFLVVPKFSLIPDQLAITVPAGLILLTGDEDADNAWLAAPTIVFTQMLTPDFDIDLAAKPFLTFADDFGDYNIAAAINVGIRLSPGDAAWSLHPRSG